MALDNKRGVDGLRLLTYNLFLRPPGIHSGKSDYKWERLRMFAVAQLPKFDIVALQECFAFGTTRRDELVRLAREAGLQHHCACPVPGWMAGRVDGGLLILSRMPIAESDFMAFPRGVHSDWLAAKGVLYAAIDISKEQKLLLFTTHTQASYEQNPPLDSPSTKIRLDQLQTVANFIRSKLISFFKSKNGQSQPLIVLLVGDFNVNARASRESGVGHSAEYESMMSMLHHENTKIDSQQQTSSTQLQFVDVLYNVLQQHPVTTNSITGIQSEPENKCLDYILHIKGTNLCEVDFHQVAVHNFHVENQLFSSLSDHCAVSVLMQPKKSA